MRSSLRVTISSAVLSGPTHSSPSITLPEVAASMISAIVFTRTKHRAKKLAIKLSNDLYRIDMIAPYRAAYHWWLRVQGRMLDHFVGMAEPMRAEIARLMRVPDERITIIEDPSLEEAQFAALAALPRHAGPRPPRYIAVGRLARQKNFPLLLRAFARLNSPAARLTILGEGAERAKLERLAVQLGIADQLSLPGHVSDPMPHYAAASVFVLSSDYEGVPAVVIEALAAGLPLVATRCSTSLPGLSPSPFSSTVSTRFVKRPIICQRCAASCRPHRDCRHCHAGHRRPASCAPHS